MHLDERQLALDRAVMAKRAGTHGEIDDPVDRNQPLELVLDLVEHVRRAAGDDGDAREMRLMFRFRNGQALDVVASAGEQADDPGENARLVVDENRKRMRFWCLGIRCNEICRAGC
ncbi:hypothetical protein D3C86_1843900 [compost metagenome]